jgi:hypothetical protein
MDKTIGVVRQARDGWGASVVVEGDTSTFFVTRKSFAESELVDGRHRNLVAGDEVEFVPVPPPAGSKYPTVGHCLELERTPYIRRCFKNRETGAYKFGPRFMRSKIYLWHGNGYQWPRTEAEIERATVKA